jgi:phthiocerol/phenolphthiocerol synthesis type-I polyketide synthase E
MEDSFDIAVIGMAARLPGAPTVEAFWKLLRDGRDAGVVYSDEVLLAAGVDQDMLRDPRYVKVGYPLADAEMFDAEFFGIPADEAELMDPQHRQFLECAVEALEDAGYDPARSSLRVGVYGGAGLNTYLLTQLAERFRTATLPGRYRLFVANDKDFLATRVSHELDLRGPSLSVNTACSSSLVAVHLACTSLLAGESDLALAGGVHVRVPLAEGYLYQEGMILSRDGRCRPFDVAAGGTNVGSGVGIVVLKRLREALDDGDRIRAVIRGTAVNNDGGHKVGYTAPSVRGQVAVIREAQRVAGVAPDTVSYVEAHGTGTALGDPVELAALAEVFAGCPAGSVAIGSVKANVGHLDTASGVAGLIKTCLMLEKGQRVGTAHLQTPVEGVRGALWAPKVVGSWPGRRRAGVSSFGIGGTNVHMVLEEAPAVEARAPFVGPQLLLLSARTPAALDRVVVALSRVLHREMHLELRDVAYTLAVGRREHPHRCAVACTDLREASLALALREGCSWGHATEQGPRLVVPPDADLATLRGLGERWVAGAELQWPALGARRVSLPGTPFEKRRCWVRAGWTEGTGLRERLREAVDREAVLTAYLRGMVAELVGREVPEGAGNVFELGLDSLMLVEVAARLSAELGREVRASALVEHASLPLFAAYLARSLG